MHGTSSSAHPFSLDVAAIWLQVLNLDLQTLVASGVQLTDWHMFMLTRLRAIGKDLSIQVNPTPSTTASACTPLCAAMSPAFLKRRL